MVLIRILTEICSRTNGTGLLVCGFVGCSRRRGLGLEDLLGEGFGRDRRKGGNTTLQVVSAEGSCQNLKGHTNMSQNLLPVAAHVPSLKLAVPERHLTSIAGVWMRRTGICLSRRCRRGHSAGCDRSHGVCEKSKVDESDLWQSSIDKGLVGLKWIRNQKQGLFHSNQFDVMTNYFDFWIPPETCNMVAVIRKAKITENTEDLRLLVVVKRVGCWNLFIENRKRP